MPRRQRHFIRSTEMKTIPIVMAAAFALATPLGAQVNTPPGPPGPRPDPAQTAPRDLPTPSHDLNDAELRSALEEQGYTQITRVQRNGMEYAVKAMRNGQSFDLVVDAMTGQIKSAIPG
jgi:hypothetical protein